MKPLLSRRSMLRGLGASGVMLPFWASGQAWARPSAAKRIIFFYFPSNI